MIKRSEQSAVFGLGVLLCLGLVACGDALFDEARGPDAPHPFYLDANERRDMIAFLLGLGTEP